MRIRNQNQLPSCSPGFLRASTTASNVDNILSVWIPAGPDQNARASAVKWALSNVSKRGHGGSTLDPARSMHFIERATGKQFLFEDMPPFLKLAVQKELSIGRGRWFSSFQEYLGSQQVGRYPAAAAPGPAGPAGPAGCWSSDTRRGASGRYGGRVGKRGGEWARGGQSG
jgi:hypothetical protein